MPAWRTRAEASRAAFSASPSWALPVMPSSLASLSRSAAEMTAIIRLPGRNGGKAGDRLGIILGLGRLGGVFAMPPSGELGFQREADVVLQLGVAGDNLPDRPQRLHAAHRPAAVLRSGKSRLPRAFRSRLIASAASATGGRMRHVPSSGERSPKPGVSTQSWRTRSAERPINWPHSRHVKPISSVRSAGGRRVNGAILQRITPDVQANAKLHHMQIARMCTERGRKLVTSGSVVRAVAVRYGHRARE